MRTLACLEVMARQAISSRFLNGGIKSITSISALILGVSSLGVSSVPAAQALTIEKLNLTSLSTSPLSPSGTTLAFSPSLPGNLGSSDFSLSTEFSSSLSQSNSGFNFENFSGISSPVAGLTLPSLQDTGISIIGLTLQSLALNPDAVSQVETSQGNGSQNAFKVVDLRQGTGNRYEDLTFNLTDVPKYAMPGFQAVGGSIYEELMAEKLEEQEAESEAQVDANAAETELIANASVALVPQPAPAVPALPAIENPLPQAPVTRSTAVSVGRADQRARLTRTVTLPRNLPGHTPAGPTLAAAPVTRAPISPTVGTAPIPSIPAPTSTSGPAPVSLIARQSTTPTLPNIELPPLQQSDRYLPNSITTQFIWPAQGVFTSGFGPRWGRMHRGIDIAAPVGTPVVASAPGVVTYAGWNDGGFGNLVELRHSDGTLTLYAHNHRVRVRVGQYVQQGELVADMGSTGRSTGPHVHFEIRPLGRGAVNPMLFLTRG